MTISSDKVAKTLRAARKNVNIQSKKSTAPAEDVPVTAAEKSSHQRNKTKRGARYQQLKRMRPFLREAFNAKAAQIKETNTIIDDTLEDIETLLDMISANPAYGITYTKDDDDPAGRRIDFYGRHKSLILSGTGHLNGADIHTLDQELRERSGDKFIFLSKCFNKADVQKSLNAIFPPREVYYTIKHRTATCPNEKPASLVIAVRGASPTQNKPQIGINLRPGAHQLSLQSLTPPHVERVTSQLAKWVMENAPEYKEQFLKDLEDLYHEEERRERHIAVYGHDRYTQRAEEDLSGRMADLDERLHILRSRHDIPAPTPQKPGQTQKTQAANPTPK